ncbi:MAG TPA: hypothetical protein VGL72_08405 [Bryobacteraceae bacterium]|jgi:hypothetical protein
MQTPWKFLPIRMLIASAALAQTLLAAGSPKDHAIRFSGPLTNLQEAPVIGNGDLAALVTIAQHEMVFQLGKNDAWDARFNNVAADMVLKEDDLIRYVRDFGFTWTQGYRGAPTWRIKPPGVGEIHEQPAAYHGNAPQSVRDTSGPAPKVIGAVRILHRGLSTTRINTTLDISRGLLTTRFEFTRGSLTIEAFIDRNANVLRIRGISDGTAPTWRIIVEKQPDRVDRTIPPPEVHATDAWHGVITQAIPAGFDVPEFRWHMAAAFPVQGAADADFGIVEPLAHELAQNCRPTAGKPLDLAVAVTTDRDGPGNSRDRAIALAAHVDYNQSLHAHQAAWQEFWSASSIELEDQPLEATWYRNLYALACHLSPNSQAPGLSANIPIWDASPWHGDYHWNMNIQKMYLSSLPTNHAEWIESYANLVDQMMPTFEYLAKLTFGLDGAYCELVTYPYIPPQRAHIHNRWGRELAMTGWVGQALWWRWEYTHDRDWLRRRAYPYLKRAAQFYWNFLQKYQLPDGSVGPAILLEQPGWNAEFRGNYNTATSLAMFRNAFRWALAASEELNVDPDWRARWKSGLDRVPAIRYGHTDGRAWVEPSKDTPPGGKDARSQTMAEWVVFPGEYVQGDETDGFAAVAREIVGDVSQRGRGSIHLIWTATPWLRLGAPGAFQATRQLILNQLLSDGQSATDPTGGPGPRNGFTGAMQWRPPEDNYLGVFGTSEMLLQSQGGVIRLFPAWPENLSAKFRLSAREGFFISAERSPAGGLKASIRSDAGLICRIRWTKPTPPVITSAGAPVKLRVSSREVEFPTVKGGVYELHHP